MVTKKEAEAANSERLRQAAAARLARESANLNAAQAAREPTQQAMAQKVKDDREAKAAAIKEAAEHVNSDVAAINKIIETIRSKRDETVDQQFNLSLPAAPASPAQPVSPAPPAAQAKVPHPGATPAARATPDSAQLNINTIIDKLNLINAGSCGTEGGSTNTLQLKSNSGQSTTITQRTGTEYTASDSAEIKLKYRYKNHTLLDAMNAKNINSDVLSNILIHIKWAS